MLQVLMPITQSCRQIFDRCYQKMKLDQEACFSTLFAKVDQGHHWRSFDAWVMGWVVHYSTLKSKATEHPAYPWMLQYMPIAYYWQGYERLFQHLGKYHLLAQLDTRYPRTWRNAQAHVLALSAQTQALLQLQRKLPYALFWQKSQCLAKALFPHLASVLSMLIGVLCTAVDAYGFKVDRMALRQILLHPELGYQVFMRLMGHADKGGVIQSFVNKKQVSWSHWLRLVLLVLFALVLFYNGALFAVHYPKKIDLYWWWMFVASVALVLLGLEYGIHRYRSAHQAQSSVRDFDHWLRSEVCTSSSMTYDVDVPSAASVPLDSALPVKQDRAYTCLVDL